MCPRGRPRGQGRPPLVQINFTLIFRSKDQIKKRSSSLSFTFFRETSLARVARLSLMVRISLRAHKFRGEDQKNKKGLRREILGSIFVFTRVFRPGTKFYSCLGGTSGILG